MWLFRHINAEIAYPSEHRRIHGAENMLSSIEPTPVEPQDGEAIEVYNQEELQLGSIALREIREA